jgi:hypothetical protein
MVIVAEVNAAVSGNSAHNDPLLRHSLTHRSVRARTSLRKLKYMDREPPCSRRSIRYY